MFYPLFRWLWLLILWVDHALFTLLLYLLSWLPHAWTRSWYPRLFWRWSASFGRALGVDLKLHQKNVRPIPTPYLLIANHPSAFEDMGIPALFDIYNLGKIEVKSWWIVGRISAAAGTLYVHRESRESRHAAKQDIIDTLRDGRNVALYPEGGCKGRRLFHQFYYGAFDISMQTGVPILPVFLHYEAQEDFEWQPPYTLLDKLRHFMTTKNNRANYYVYDVLDPAQFSSKEEYCDHAHNLYLKWQAQYLE